MVCVHFVFPPVGWVDGVAPLLAQFSLTMYIILSGGKLTAVVILPNSGKTSFGALMKTTQDVRGFFGRHYPSAFGHEGPSVEVAKDFHERRWEGVGLMHLQYVVNIYAKRGDRQTLLGMC